MSDYTYLYAFLKEGFYVRIPKEQYETYIGKLPDVYTGIKYAYIYLDMEEEIPANVYVWPPLLPRTDTGFVDVTKEVPLKTEKPGLLYQYFRGCKTMCRQYTRSPVGAIALAPDARPWDIKATPGVGYLDESNSPFDFPSPLSEIFIVKGVSFEMLAWNPTPIPLTPETNFIGKKFRFSLIEDRDVIKRLEDRVIPSRPISFEKRITPPVG